MNKTENLTKMSQPTFGQGGNRSHYHNEMPAMGIVMNKSDSDILAKKRSAYSLRICLFCFWLYFISYTLIIPAFPSLLLEATNGNSSLASSYYGFATSIRYTLEFFSCPFLGNMSDSVGRKKILIISLITVFAEFFLLALFPAVITVIIVSVISGLGNAALAMGYAIMTDLAFVSGEPVTNNFGYFSAIFGLGFIIGPLCGSMLIAVNLRLCFLVAAATCLLSLAVAVFFLDETCVNIRPYDSMKSSPIYSLRVFFANKKLLQLSVPYMFSNLCTGIYFIWVLYMTYRFQADILQIGTVHCHCFSQHNA
jgi:MFS transporter, DHA1 family, tetracycline resistance protein